MTELSLETWASLHSTILQRVRESLSWDMPIQQWQVLCEIASNQGISSAELRDRLNMTGGSLTRNIKALSVYTKKDVKGNMQQHGHELVDIRIDPYERRARIYFLTKKGHEFMRKIHHEMQKMLNIAGGHDVAI